MWTFKKRKKEENTEQKLKLTLWAFSLLIKGDEKIEKKEIVKLKEFLNEEFIDITEEKLKEYIDKFLKFNISQLINYFESNLKNSLNQQTVSRDFRRRLLYSLSGILKSKSKNLSPKDYETLIIIGEKLGFSDVYVNSVIEDVFSIKDTLLILSGISIILGALYFLKDFFVPLVFAYFISRVIKHIDRKFVALFRLKKSTRFVTFLSTLLILLIVFGLFYVGKSAFISIYDDYPILKKQITYQTKNMPHWIKKLILSPEVENSKGIYFNLNSSINKIISNLSVFSLYFTLIVVYTLFLSFSKNFSESELSDMDKKISNYITVKFFISIFTGLLFTVTTFIMGIKYSILWGFLAFILNFIPNLGSIVATIFPTVFTFIVAGIKESAVILIILTAIQFFMGNIVEPMVLGASMELKPLTVLGALVFWGIIWGVSGMFLSAPLMVVIKTVGENYNFSRKFARVL